MGRDPWDGGPLIKPTNTPYITWVFIGYITIFPMTHVVDSQDDVFNGIVCKLHFGMAEDSRRQCVHVNMHVENTKQIYIYIFIYLFLFTYQYIHITY